MVKLGALGFMHRHRPGGFMLGQTAGLERLHAPVRHLEPDAQALTAVERNPDIPVKQSQRAVVTGDHHRSPFIPARVRGTVNFAFLRQQLFQPVVQTPDAKGTFPQRTEQLILAKRGNDLLRRTLLLYARQKVLVPLQGVVQHCLILFPTLQRFFLNIRKGTVKYRSGCALVAPVHRCRKLADAGVAAETVAFLQQTQAVAQRPCKRMVFRGERTSGETG